MDLNILHKAVKAPSYSKQPSMVMAHFNPKELDMMDHLQGESKRNSAGVRTYNGLYHGLMKHGPIKETFLEHAREHNAQGGAIRAKLDRMKAHGRYGDTEVAYIPHGLAEIFDHAIGGPVYNPHDGHREYFSLSDKLAPLMGMLSRGAGHIGNFARSAGNSVMSGARRAGNAVSNGFNRMTGRNMPHGQVPATFRNENPARETYRDWAHRGVQENVGPPLRRTMGTLGSAGGAYLGHRAASVVDPVIPLPNSMIHAPAMAYGGYKGYKAGTNLADKVTNALASGAGKVASVADTAQRGANFAQNVANNPNPSRSLWGGLSPFAGSTGLPGGIPSGAPHIPAIGRPLLEDVD